MADVETLLLSKIISSLDIETTIAAGIEIDWFEDLDFRRIYKWMLEYRRRYQEAPTPDALKREYPNFKPADVPESYQYYIDKFKLRHKRAVVVDAIIGADKALESDDPVRALHIMAQAQHRAIMDDGEDEITSVLASEIQPRKVRWLWPARIPLGKVTVLGGDSGLGKTTMLVDVIARSSSGRKLPLSTAQHKPMKCLIMSAEDDLADTLVPRLLAAGANLDNVEFITGRRSADGETMLSFPQDIVGLRSKMVSTKARLIMIDPFNAFLDAKTDSYRDADIRRVLAPLSKLAEDTGAAVVPIFHLKKSQGGKALHQIVGSVGIGAAARSVLLVATNPEDEDERVLAVTKMSNAPKHSSLVFRIEGSGRYGAAKAKWLRGSRFTADELVRPRRAGEDSALSTAEDFLSDLLDRNGGEMAVNQIMMEAKSANIAEATLRRAKISLGVLSRKSGADQGNIWLWYLPGQPKSDSAT